jgi:hypothetical protein
VYLSWVKTKRPIIFVPIGLFLAVLVFSCTSTKVATYPSVVGHINNESILIADVAQGKTTLKRIELIAWAQKEIAETLPSLKTFDYMDIVYQARQQGVHLEALEVMDTVALQVLHRQLGFTYLLIPRIILQNENRLSDQPGLMTDIREAVLQFVLVDLRTNTILWTCIARSRVSPWVIEGRDFDYSVNPFSSNRAFTQAYRKSIKALIQAMDFYYRKPE